MRPKYKIKPSINQGQLKRGKTQEDCQKSTCEKLVSEELKKLLNCMPKPSATAQKKTFSGSND